MNILFICGRNQWRSPTAADIYKDHVGVNVRSAGLSQSSRHRVNRKDLQWADLILVMEYEHKDQLRSQFREQFTAAVKVLDIPDDYQYMDPELISLLQTAVDPYINC